MILLNALAAIVGVVLALAALGLIGFGVILLAERIRRFWADRHGFADFLKAGAPLRHERLLKAFEDPETLSTDREKASIVPMGDIAIPSGRLVVEDPGHAVIDHEGPAEFDETFPIGRFPMEGLILRAGEDQRLAAIRIRFAQSYSDLIEPAFTEEWRSVQAQARRELPWFGIDSATAAIGTPESFAWFLQRAHEHDERWSKLFPGEEKGANPYLSENPADLFRNSSVEDSSICIAYSGLGDGVGHCYVQRDHAGRPAALIIDFGMLGRPDWAWTRPVMQKAA